MAIIAMNIPLAEESIRPTHLVFTSRREGYDSDKKTMPLNPMIVSNGASEPSSGRFLQTDCTIRLRWKRHVRFLDSPWAITQSSPIHPEHFVDEAREVARKEMPYLCTQGDCRASRTVTVKDAKGNKGTLSCSITVYQSISSMCDCTRITPTQGVAISPVTLTAGGGAGGPYTFSATGLPAGLTFRAAACFLGRRR